MLQRIYAATRDFGAHSVKIIWSLKLGYGLVAKVVVVSLSNTSSTY
jgi:hypothetical protein